MNDKPTIKTDRAMPRSARQDRVTYHPDTLEACRRGDRQAMDHVLRTEAPALARLIARMVGPGHHVEDLLQDVLIAAVEAFPRFRGEAAVRTWLSAIATRVAYNHLRRGGRRPVLSLVQSDALLHDGPDPEALASEREVLARLHGHLAGISPKKRIAFVLHAVEGRPMKEVAELMGAGVAATKSRVLFARRALLARIGRDPALLAVLSKGGGRR